MMVIGFSTQEQFEEHLRRMKAPEGEMSEIQKIAQDIVPELRRHIDNWLRSEMILGSKEYRRLELELWGNKIGILRLLEHAMLPAPLPAQEWQDISTAPKDGTVVLVFENPRRTTCRYDTHHKQWLSVPGAYSMHPTHWMPLPAGPVAVIAEERGS